MYLLMHLFIDAFIYVFMYLCIYEFFYVFMNFFMYLFMYLILSFPGFHEKCVPACCPLPRRARFFPQSEGILVLKLFVQCFGFGVCEVTRIYERL